MSHAWNELVATLGDRIGLPLALLLLFVTATLAALLWYFHPRWIPRRWPDLRRLRWPRLRWPRFRWPRFRWPGFRRPTVDWKRFSWSALLARWRAWWRAWRRRKPAATPEPAPDHTAHEVPELPAEEFANLADRLAAEGRYAEAVRERLRGIVRHLIERGVLDHRPGWTVTELAAAAAARRPPLAAPLNEAGSIFSDIWYGQHPATRAHDDRMRELAGASAAAVDGSPVGARS
jgi:hypothetical protein